MFQLGLHPAHDGGITGRQGSLFNVLPDDSPALRADQRFRDGQTQRDNETGDMLTNPCHAQEKGQSDATV